MSLNPCARGGLNTSPLHYNALTKVTRRPLKVRAIWNPFEIHISTHVCGDALRQCLPPARFITLSPSDEEGLTAPAHSPLANRSKSARIQMTVVVTAWVISLHLGNGRPSLSSLTEPMRLRWLIGHGRDRERGLNNMGRCGVRCRGHDWAFISHLTNASSGHRTPNLHRDF